MLLALALLSVSSMMAQPEDKQAAREKMEAARVGMITTKLNLTTKQAQQFWPVYNEYRSKQDGLRKKMRALKKREMKTDADYNKGLDEMLKNKEAEVALEKEYKDKFLKVISARQLMELFKAEREFKMMLLHKIEGRRAPKGHRGPPRNGPPHGGPMAPPMD